MDDEFDLIDPDSGDPLPTPEDMLPSQYYLEDRKDIAYPKLSYYLYDHLGNTRVVFQVEFIDCCNGVWNYVVESAMDYYPYGKTLREYQTGVEKYLTTQHERDAESGLDYRGARFYDSDVARFLSLDPLAADYVSWSAYNYVAGNPIKYIDPNGKKWVDPEEAEKLKSEITDVENKLTERKSEIEEELTGDGLSDKKKARLEGELGDIASRLSELSKSKKEIDDLGADESRYYDLIPNLSSEAHVTRSNKKHEGKELILIPGQNSAIHIHEIKHVALSLRVGFEFDENTRILKTTTKIGYLDELKAYRAQYAFNPSTLPGESTMSQPSRMKDIDLKYLATITNSSGYSMYPKIYQFYLHEEKKKESKKRN